MRAMTGQPKATKPRPAPREGGGISPVAIVLPSVVSGVGAVFILLAVLVNQSIVQDVALSVGVILLWLDFFITMAVLRHALRSIDRRLRRLEARGGGGDDSGR